ncbi:UDP-glucose 4-epimerase [candidate division WOR_3 bacterium SM23_42]|uniref:UDP-glucose 4-epimerase n=1 Tax=candidate division WOR_3 bacterium SM23_42 TaxID=1703779 RepID=A0A0S8FT36_UNCW3|nr:MAG: UDP-glucose 4-epimerase [candidate division WOR_3 bacterium SM23_42]
MKILVTGGCGFIGSHIVDAYVAKGHEVVVIDDLSTGNIDNLNRKAKFYQEKIYNNIAGIFEEEKFQLINHHAAQINVRTSVDDPIYDAQVNVLGTTNLLHLASRYGIKRFIFASSGGAVYGEPDEYPINENAALAPLSPYGASKVAAEKYIMTFARLYNMDYVILRYSNVYGPRQIIKSEAGVISIFTDRILRSQSCDVYGDGEQIRDYVFVGDVVEANLLALECTPNIFNIGTNVETSVNDLIDVFSSIVKKEVVHQHIEPRPGEVFRNVLDYSRAFTQINWQPKTKLEDGILKTFEYFKRIFRS